MSLEHITYIGKSYAETSPRIVDNDTEWQDKAICKGMIHLFFMPFNERPLDKEKREAAAKAICKVCPVIKECLEYSLVNQEQGIWGNTNDEDRFMQYGVLPYAGTNTKFTRNDG
jgi:WhiB family redox-sensing transcriptional regulator